MRKIKKYANRKLYDTLEKRYVTLNRLGELIQSGERIEVVENATGQDITAGIVSQIMARNQSEEMRKVSSRFLMDLLRKSGDTIADVARKYTSLWQHVVHAADGEIDKLVSGLTAGRKLTADETKKLREEIRTHTDKLKKRVGSRIDQRLEQMADTMNLASSDQVAELVKQVEALRRKVASLEKQLATQVKAGGKKRRRS